MMHDSTACVHNSSTASAAVEFLLLLLLLLLLLHRPKCEHIVHGYLNTYSCL
jgi:hypothetical protein